MERGTGPKEERKAGGLQFNLAKQTLTEFFVLVAVTSLFLVLLEAGCFLGLRGLSIVTRDVHLRDEILSGYRGKNWAPALAREQEASAHLDFRPYIVWQRRPYRGETVVIENERWRRTFHSQCDHDAYTIWMFGGSTMWGVGSPDWGTIPSSLAELYERAGRSVCVRNYGEDGWVSTQEVIALMLELKRAARKPDLVVFYDGANDTFLPYQSGRVDVHMNFNIIRQQLESENGIRRGGAAYLRQTNTAQLIFALARLLAQPARSPLSARTDLDSLARAVVRNYLQNIDLVDALACRYGFEYAFFWQPLVFTAHKPLTPQEERLGGPKSGTPPEAWCRKVYELMRSEHRANLFDIEDVFDNVSDQVFLSWCHVVMSGNQIIATRMYQSLIGR